MDIVRCDIYLMDDHDECHDICEKYRQDKNDGKTVLLPTIVFLTYGTRWDFQQLYDVVQEFFELFEIAPSYRELHIKPRYKHLTFQRTPEEQEKLFQKHFGSRKEYKFQKV